MSLNLYPQEEQERINKMKEINERLEDYFKEKREKWTSSIDPLFKVLSTDFNMINVKNIIECQAHALSFRQSLNDEISLFLNKRSKELPKLKKIKQDKFVFYALGVGIKTNMGEKSLLIDAHLAENDRNIELIEAYIEFLRDSVKTLETYQYSIKNVISLMEYMGK